jgi:rhamnosyltransferase
MQIASGIVTFNPDIKRLADNIEAIMPQVDRVYIYDNGSKNLDEIVSLISDKFHDRDVVLIDGLSNRGMSVALNGLAKRATDDGLEYIYMLDQDSVSTEGIVAELAKYVSDDIGILSPIAMDRNADIPHGSNDKPYEIMSSITSGSLINLAAYTQVGGYDERLFVDLVDFDFSLNMKMGGFKVVRVPSAVLVHELGHQEFALFFPTRIDGGGIQWKQYRTNHSSFRRYDTGRSWAVLTRKYAGTSCEKYLKSVMRKTTIKSMAVEKHKGDYVKQLRKGYKDGLKVFRDNVTY